jgi:hypothetical protein
MSPTPESSSVSQNSGSRTKSGVAWDEVRLSIIGVMIADASQQSRDMVERVSLSREVERRDMPWIFWVVGSSG